MFFMMSLKVKNCSWVNYSRERAALVRLLRSPFGFAKKGGKGIYKVMFFGVGNVELESERDVERFSGSSA